MVHFFAPLPQTKLPQTEDAQTVRRPKRPSNDSFSEADEWPGDPDTVQLTSIDKSSQKEAKQKSTPESAAFLDLGVWMTQRLAEAVGCEQIVNDETFDWHVKTPSCTKLFPCVHLSY